IGLHIFTGQVNPKTLRTTAHCKEFKLQTLIDNGSTHNFFPEKVAYKVGLPIQPTKPFRVYVGSGQFLNCLRKCVNVPLKLQAYQFSIDFFVLPIEGADVVLGIQWLETLGPIHSDYKLLTMHFVHQNSMVCLKGEPQYKPELVTAKELKRLALYEGTAAFFHLKGSTINNPSHTTSTKLPPLIADILLQFSRVFDEPT
ncbi:RVP_2 domain-containing protein, partial [Cephalotus follicularis]